MDTERRWTEAAHGEVVVVVRGATAGAPCQIRDGRGVVSHRSPNYWEKHRRLDVPGSGAELASLGPVFSPFPAVAILEELSDFVAIPLALEATPGQSAAVRRRQVGNNVSRTVGQLPKYG